MEKFRLKDLKTLQPDDMDTIEECEYVMRALDAEIADMDGRLTEAKMLAASRKQFSDPAWYRHISQIMKFARRARVSAQDRKTLLTRRAKLAENEAFSQRFISASRLILDRETFLEIVETAKAMEFQARI